MTAMTKKAVRKVVRAATPAEVARHTRVRELIAAEMPELQRLGRESRSRALARRAAARGILDSLRERREAAEKSLVDVARHMGTDKSNLSRLESGRSANPTLDTLQKYAQALGLELRIELVEPAAVRSTKG